MVTRLAAFEDEKSEDDEERSESLSVFNIDDLLEILADEELAHEDERDVQQWPQSAETWRATGKGCARWQLLNAMKHSPTQHSITILYIRFKFYY